MDNKAELKAKVHEYIKKQGGVSYAELENLFDDLGYSYKGTALSCSSMCEHVVFWEGWHKRAFSIIGELLKEGKIYREPAPMWLYLIDGKGLTLPVFTEKTNYKRIKQDYWLPCVFQAA